MGAAGVPVEAGGGRGEDAGRGGGPRRGRHIMLDDVMLCYIISYCMCVYIYIYNVICNDYRILCNLIVFIFL